MVEHQPVPVTYSINDWINQPQPHLKQKVSLTPGMVFWSGTSAHDSREDGDGSDKVYVGGGSWIRIPSGSSSFESEDSIRKNFVMGIYKKIPLEELSEERKQERIEAIHNFCQQEKEDIEMLDEEGYSTAYYRERLANLQDIVSDSPYNITAD